MTLLLLHWYADVTLLHFGALHAYERWLAIALAFGPFIVLGVVIGVRRRRDAAEDE